MSSHSGSECRGRGLVGQREWPVLLGESWRVDAGRKVWAAGPGVWEGLGWEVGGPVLPPDYKDSSFLIYKDEDDCGLAGL